MPVEVNRIKGRLKALFPKANLSSKRIDEISARLAKKPADDADDAAVDQVINDANDFMPFSDIAKEDDRIRTLEANQKKPDPKPADDGKPDPKPDPTPDPDDVPAWAKGMLDTNKKLLEKVENLEKGKITENKLAAARKTFNDNETFKGAKESTQEFFFKQLDPNSETSIEDQISDLETQYKDMVQVNADSGDYSGKPPAGGKEVDKPSDAEIEDVASRL